MKRDMDLIRAVLLNTQSGNPNGEVEGYTPEATRYHKALAIEAGLLSGSVLPDRQKGSEIPSAVIVKDLTWQGHDFLDGIESESNWAKVKKFLADAGKQLTLETIKWGIKQVVGVG